MNTENWLRAVDLTSIAFYLMIMTVAVLLYTSRMPKKSKSSKR